MPSDKYTALRTISTTIVFRCSKGMSAPRDFLQLNEPFALSADADDTA